MDTPLESDFMLHPIQMQTPMNNRFEHDMPLVLVIDDEQDVLNTVATTLADANIPCHCCSRPEEAVAFSMETPPDLILCDMNLFGESGPETCERIKQQPGLERIPVIFLSSAQMPDIIRRSHGSNSTYCLRKPFAASVLVGLIDVATSSVPQLATVDAVQV
jgi:CheY-like chemotaxis protein